MQKKCKTFKNMHVVYNVEKKKLKNHIWNEDGGNYSGTQRSKKKGALYL